MNSPRATRFPPSHSSFALPSCPAHRSSMLTDDPLEIPNNHAYRRIQKKPKYERGQLTSYHYAQRGQNLAATSDCRNVGRVTIDILPDLVLLELFNFYVHQTGRIEKWHTLIHVCQRWRNVVFGSPRRLGLQLFCTARKPVKDTLDVWPPLPIVVRHGSHTMSGMDNILAALKRTNRVCEIRLWPVPRCQWDNVLPVMEQPFPELTDLKLRSKDETAPVLPNSFLGGFAPRLRSLRLERIPFPGLPDLLFTCTGLVKLSLQKIPHSGYISPEAVITCLSTLTGLAELELSFLSPLSLPDRAGRRLPSFTLPALRHFKFVGVSEYLEDLVAQIDSPLLDNLHIKFFHQLVYDTPELTQFISRTPGLKGYKEAYINISRSGISVQVLAVVGRGLQLEISCSPSDWQLSSLSQICNSSVPRSLIGSLEDLYICDDEQSRPLWQDDIDNCQWLELLQPFMAVKDLYLSREFTSSVVPALKEIVEGRMTDVLPALQCLYLEEGPEQDLPRKMLRSFLPPEFLRQSHSHFSNYRSTHCTFYPIVSYATCNCFSELVFWPAHW